MAPTTVPDASVAVEVFQGGAIDSGIAGDRTASDGSSRSGFPAQPDAGVSDRAVAARSWIDKNQYRFRLDEVRRCAPEDVGAEVADELRVAALVQIESRSERLSVSAGDLTLEANGIITGAELSVGKPSRGCVPALPPRQLKPGQIARGFVEFRVPPSQRTKSAVFVLAYRPTRWGGADRVEIKLPPCLGLPGGCVDGDPPPAPSAAKPEKMKPEKTKPEKAKPESATKPGKSKSGSSRRRSETPQ